jgi:hypothetical protein
VAKDDEAIDLAQRHYEVDVAMKDIIRFTDHADIELDPAEPIKLLEVSESTVEAGAMPIYFGPAPEAGIHFPSVIVEVTPDEYRRIQNLELQLPEGWRFAVPIPRTAAAANE